MATPNERSLLSAQVIERIDLSELIPFNQVPKELPIRVHISGPHRWRKVGSHGVLLRAVKVPGCGWCTTREWLTQFISDVTAARAASDAQAPSSPRRSRRLAAAFKSGKGVRS